MKFTARFRGFLFSAVAVSVLSLLGVMPSLAHEEDDPFVRHTGVVTVLRADNFETGRSETFVELEFPDPSGRAGAPARRTRVRFEGTLPEGVTTGAVVRVRARRQGEELSVLAADGPGGIEVVTAAAPLVGGEQKTIVILVNFLDRNISYTASDLQNRVFTSATSIDKFYQEASFGQMWFTGNTYGPYTINYSSTGAMDYNGWALAADAAATAAGVPVNDYPRRAYMVPAAATGWGGLGTLGGNPSRCWVQGSNVGSNSIIAHELGHNLGMHHASTPTAEYGDSSDVMGSGMRHPNAPHKVQMGWVPSERVLSPTASGSYSVAVLETASSGTQVIRIPAPDGGDPYYFSFRKATTFGGSTTTIYTDKTSVHRWKGGSNRTFVLQALGDGGSFTDPTGQFTVTQVGHTADAASLSITLPAPAPLPPTLVFSPASLATKPSMSYSMSVRVTNLDTISSSPSTFQLTTRSVPAGWSMTFNPTSLTISAGGSATASLVLVIPSGTVAGSYSCTAQVADALQPIHSVTATLPVTIDATPPTAPSNLTASASAYTATNARVDLSWSASTDDIGVTSYSVTRTLGSTTWFFSTTGTTYSDLTASYGTTYTYGVSARDAAGNTSSKVSLIVSTPGTDTTPPTCSISSPSAGSQVAGVVTVSAGANDNTSVARVEFFVDGVLKGTDTTSPYAYSWDTKTVANGDHDLTAKAFDGSGNSASSSVVRVAVNNVADTTGPTLAIVSPIEGSTVTGRVSVSVSASDPSGVLKVEFYVDGALKSTDLSAPWSWTWNTKSYRGRTVVLSVKGYDGLGNVTTASCSIRVQ